VKVLFDTNVHVSDAIFGGNASLAITATLAARWKIFVCPTILSELDRVIRTEFHRSQSFVNATVQAVRDISDVAGEPISRHRVPDDPNDSPILRAALAASVDYLVTGDAKLLAMNPVEGVRIVTLVEYLHVLQSHGFALE
jgi:putative PIN family toxin of toxin-antitoxin system